MALWHAANPMQHMGVQHDLKDAIWKCHGGLQPVCRAHMQAHCDAAMHLYIFVDVTHIAFVLRTEGRALLHCSGHAQTQAAFRVYMVASGPQYKYLSVQYSKVQFSLAAGDTKHFASVSA